MNLWTMIVLIVLIGAAASVLRARFKARQAVDWDRTENRDAPPLIQTDEEAQREIAALKERIAVLERIAYDKNSATAQERARISAEIDALREQQD